MGSDSKVLVNIWPVMAITIICVFLVTQIDTVHGKSLATNEVDVSHSNNLNLASAASEAGTRQQKLVKRSAFQDESFATDYEREERSVWTALGIGRAIYNGVKNVIDKGRR